MKKTIVAILITVLLLSMMTTSYALTEDSNNDESNIEIINSELPEVLKLDVINAIEYALSNNVDMKIEELNIMKQEVAYDETRKQVRESNEAQELMGSNSTPVDLLVEKKLMDLGVIERSASLSMNVAKWNKDIKTNQIKYDVEKAYFDLLQAQNELEIAREGLELANKQCEQSEMMYDLGNISKQQLIAIELGVSQAQSGVDAAQMGYELQKMNFNNTLGLPLDQKIELTDKIEYKEHEDIVLEEAINQAFENNGGLKVVSENYELSKLTLIATKSRYPENTYKYREQAVAVEIAAKNLEMTKTGIEMGVRSAYLNLTTAEKQIATYELSVEKAQKALELAQISFELGQNTANDVTQARIEFMDAKKNLSKQIHAYNMALLDFKYSTGLGKTPIVAGY